VNDSTLDKIDPARANWLNLLPPLKGKTVLILGNINHHIFESLRRCGCSSISCIDKEGMKTKPPELRIVKNDSASGENEKFDFCIVGQSDSFSIFNNFFKKSFEHSFNVLNPNGIILLGCYNTCFIKKYKRRYVRMLKDAGYSGISSFICTPSFDNPLNIYPFPYYKVTNQKIFNFFLKDYFRIKGIKILIKDFIKYFVFKARCIIKPPCGLLFLSKKNKDPLLKTEFDDFFNSKQEEPNHDSADLPSFTTWHSKPFVAKHIGLFYKSSKDEKQLKFVIKKSNYKQNRTDIIIQEHNVLKFLFDHKSFFDNNNIALPEPVFAQEDSGGVIITAESAVLGQQLNEIGVMWHYNIEKYKKILNGFVKCQILIQQYLSKNFIDKSPIIPDILFKNHLDIDFDSYKDASRIQEYTKHVQHGDYTAVNLYYDKSNIKFGIIDWEWLSSGFPPIFDLFHFFLSIEFLNGATKQSDLFSNYFHSFMLTYFRKNWFSDLIKENVLIYCRTLNIPNDKIFNYFMDFLLILHNKYFLYYHATNYVELHKKMIRYSIKNKSEFIFF
jgi:hypothetical protein